MMGRRLPSRRPWLSVVLLTVLAQMALAQGPAGSQGGRGGQPPRPERKQVLVWAEMTGGGAYHPSANAAMVAIYGLGKQTGLFDTTLRTDSQFITKQTLTVQAGGRDWRVGRNLDSFDAIFFFGMREIPLSEQQMNDLLSFVKDDGKGFVAAHTAINAFERFPEFAVMMGAGYDGHPWGQVEATVVVEDPAFPSVAHFPRTFAFRDEMYQVKNFSREDSRVLLALDPSSVDLTRPNVNRTDGDFPQAWARMYGKGRVFVGAFGHDESTWERPEIKTMWLEALKWALGLTEADVTPRPKPAGKIPELP
jgi:uncharacterized protein